MAFVMLILALSLIFGVAAVASNPSPYFAALGLVVAAGAGCGLLVSHGGSFLSLVLFLIYLGGMLVVFAYSAALAAEPYPETWGNRRVLGMMSVYLVGVGLAAGSMRGGWHGVVWSSCDEFGEFFMLRADMGGVALLYSGGGLMLMLGVGVLLLALFVVLELTRGLSRGALRAV
uniref:NADH dehydrogenase subunit 6 n=1 Tax=Ambassis agassizii TaxID=613159 RepID=UPI0026E319C6|nr:NADH dehydrogenase subunit 6 [Ambassis agassizii]WJQ22022.1 NADH dehydrogenase subunit 6 [Ambassis agassizii]WJQ22035.1 NADH dehydrogenase subunit 6 [Ambassis agassizii]